MTILAIHIEKQQDKAVSSGFCQIEALSENWSPRCGDCRLRGPRLESEARAFSSGWFLSEVDGVESSEVNQYSQERQKKSTGRTFLDHADPLWGTKMAQGLIGNRSLGADPKPGGKLKSRTISIHEENEEAECLFNESAVGKGIYL